MAQPEPTSPSLPPGFRAHPPKCELYEPRYPQRHLRGSLAVSAKPPPSLKLPPDFRSTYRVCALCLFNLTYTMRREGYTQITVTSPERIPFEPHRGAD